MNLSHIAILKIKNADYCYFISGISKSEPINKVNNIIWTKTSGTLSNFSNCKLTTNSNLNQKSEKL